jgi:hypothetical protein
MKSLWPSEYLSSGPLHGLKGCPEAQDAEWGVAGRQLAKQLGFDHDAMDDVQK